ncbi:MAG: NnrU family protein, partial [Candidatus Binatia bacterium]
THTVLTHPPIRSALVARLGVGPFQGLFSLVAFATFVPLVWTFFANRPSTAMPLPSLLDAPRFWPTMLLMAFAVVLLVVGFVQPSPFSIGAHQEPRASGVLRITRHPVFMAAAILGAAHLLVNHTDLDRAFFGGLLVYSLLGSAHQEWRKRREGGETLRRFYAETSFLPFVAIASGRNRLSLRELPLAGVGSAVAVFVLIFAFHHRLFG